jgi:two-component system, OmpR family, response regulator RpaA
MITIDDEEVLHAPRNRTLSVQGGIPPKLILLVEGDPANAHFFLHILTQEASFRVFWATNGRATWHFTEHVKPQLILLEYSLPDTNGIIFYDWLHARKELEAVPALIIGASLKEGEVAIKQRGLLAMEKPFDQDKVLSAIESLFASSSGKPRW